MRSIVYIGDGSGNKYFFHRLYYFIKKLFSERKRRIIRAKFKRLNPAIRLVERKRRVRKIKILKGYFGKTFFKRQLKAVESESIKAVIIKGLFGGINRKRKAVIAEEITKVGIQRSLWRFLINQL